MGNIHNIGRKYDISIEATPKDHIAPKIELNLGFGLGGFNIPFPMDEKFRFGKRM